MAVQLIIELQLYLDLTSSLSYTPQDVCKLTRGVFNHPFIRIRSL